MVSVKLIIRGQKMKYLMLEVDTLVETYVESLEGLEGYMLIEDVIKNRNQYYYLQETRNGYEYRKWNNNYNNGVGRYSWEDMKRINISMLSVNRIYATIDGKNKQNRIIKNVAKHIQVKYFVWVNNENE
jgi:SOS response regulatory protein OraA/RecX